MNREQHKELIAPVESPPTTVSVEEVEGSDRTLLYGYDTAYSTLHVYKRAGELHLHWYRSGMEVVKGVTPIQYVHGDSLVAATLIPNKRLYPAACDYHFATLLLERGLDLPWTTWRLDQHTRYVGALHAGGFYGEVA